MTSWIQDFPTLMYRTHDFELEIRLLEPGVIQFLLAGRLSRDKVDILCEYAQKLQSLLMAQNALCCLYLNLSRVGRSNLPARTALLKKLRWRRTGRVLGIYVVLANPLMRSLFQILAQLNAQTPLHFFADPDAALAGLTKAMQQPPQIAEPVSSGPQPEPQSEPLQPEQLLWQVQEQRLHLEQFKKYMLQMLTRDPLDILELHNLDPDSPFLELAELLMLFQQDRLQMIEDLQQEIDERSRAERQAAEANAIKSQFLATMSHEIRTPLNALLGFTEVLRRNPEQMTARQQLYLERMHVNGQQLLELVNDILDLASIEARKLPLKLERVCLNQLVEQAIQQLEVLAHNKNLELLNALDQQYWILTDYQRLQQILLNLLNNGIKYTERGHVQIRVQPLPDQGLQIEVRDTGMGISTSQQALIFEAFTQLNPGVPQEGVGLGLAICHHLCEWLGYSLGLESTPEQGSCFWIQIPEMLECLPLLPLSESEA